MRTVAHISDLHFGTEQPKLAEGLLAELERARPHLIVVSGDLTQRARARQFEKAAEYLKRLPAPFIVIPGNHDVPLYDVARRFLAPLQRYQKWINDELNPTFEDEEVFVLALNTARSLTWKSGRLSQEQIERIQEKFCSAPETAFKILVTHHPFIPPPGEEAAGVDLVGRASEALGCISDCKVDLLLAGHLHHGYSGDIRTFYPEARRSVIVVQAGTAISHRTRNEPNAFNLLRLEKERIEIGVYVWNETLFAQSTLVKYELRDEEWRRIDREHRVSSQQKGEGAV